MASSYGTGNIAVSATQLAMCFGAMCVAIVETQERVMTQSIQLK